MAVYQTLSLHKTHVVRSKSKVRQKYFSFFIWFWCNTHLVVTFMLNTVCVNRHLPRGQVPAYKPFDFFTHGCTPETRD